MATLPRKLAFRQEHTGDHVLDRAQRGAQKATDGVNTLTTAFNSVPFLNGKLVTGLVFTAAVAKTVTHGLGRVAAGYIIVRNYGANVANVVGESGAAAADPLNQIVLITTVNSTFDIWFF